MTSPIIFHNLFDDDETDAENEDTLSEVSVPVLHSVEELFSMMAECNTAAVADSEHVDKSDMVAGEENDDKSEGSSIGHDKPKKKLRPSRPLKYKNSLTKDVPPLPTSVQESSETLDTPETLHEEKSETMETSVAIKDGSKEITLKMGSRNSKPALNLDQSNPEIVSKTQQSILQSKSVVMSPIVVKREKAETDVKVKQPLNKATSIKLVQMMSKNVKTPTQVAKIKQEPGKLKTEKLSLPSTVRVTLVKEDDDDVKVQKSGESLPSNEDLSFKMAEKEELILSQQKMIDEFRLKNEEVKQTLALKEEFINSQQMAIEQLQKKNINVEKAEKLSDKIVEKEEFILSQQKIISELGIKNEEVEQKLVLREEFIDSQQRVIDDLEKQSVNAHKVEKLSNQIAEKEEEILSHQRIIKELGMKNEEVQQNLVLREEFIDSQQKVIDELEKESINAHKVEKLSSDLQERIETISRLTESEQKLISQLLKSEEGSQSQLKTIQDLKHQLSMLKSDNNSNVAEIKKLIEKCSALEKEKEVLTEMGNSHRSTSEDILKTVEALKGKIDDVMTNDSREEEFMSQISSLKNEIMNLTIVKKDLEEEVKSVRMSLYNKTEESSLLEGALSEKIDSIAKLEKEISKLSDKLKEMKKNLEHKSSKSSKMDKENGKLKEKLKDLEKEIELKVRECTSFKKAVDEKTAGITSSNEEIEKFKVQLTEMEERLNLETGKSVELIKKINFSEKLVFTKENDYLALKDQQLILESNLRISKRKIDDYEKDNIKFVEANLKVKCLEDEKKDLLKEIRKVSELQKKVKFLEAKLKKYYNFYQKQTEQEPEELENSSISPNLEVMDIPDPKEIDAILNQISQDVTKHTESIATEVSVKEIPLPRTEQTDLGSQKLESASFELVSGPQEETFSSIPNDKDDLEQMNTSLEEEDGLLHAWKSRMKQTPQFSGYTNTKLKQVEISKIYHLENDANTRDIPTKPSTRMKDADKAMSAEVDDIVVISSHEFKSSGKKKHISSDSDDEDNERSRKHKSKRSKKKSKKYKSKTDEKDRSRERKRHRSGKNSGSLVKTRSRTRSRSSYSRRAPKDGRKSRSRSRRNTRSPSKSRSRSRSKSRNNIRRKVLKEERNHRSRSRSRELIRNVSHSPGKRSKRARSSSSSKPASQNIASESPRKRFQPRLKSKSRSPAVVKDANFALSKEITSIIEKLQEAKTDNVATSPTIKDTPATKEHVPLVMKYDEALLKNPVACKSRTNIVANYSSEFEEISDEELTLAEDCLDEPEQTSDIQEKESTCNEIPSFGLLPEKEQEVDEKILQERVGHDQGDVLNNSTHIEVTQPTEVQSTEASPLSVFLNMNCPCCGAKLTGSAAEDAQHFEEGECKKKSDWIKQGLPLICAYCTNSGSHWVAACPLLASFCFTCWTWGHSMDTHTEEDGEKTVVRLLACYNRFRLNHLANSGRSEQYKVFPSNSKVDGMWRFMGSMEDVESVARKIPGHMGKPVPWLTHENWVRLRGLESKKES